MLLRSGEQFSTFTVQGRFLAYHLNTRALYEYYSARWMFDRFVDLITVCGFSTVDQGSSQNYTKNVTAARDSVLDIIKPDKSREAQENLKMVQDDVKKRDFLDKIGELRPEGFKSLNDLKASLGRLAHTIDRMEEASKEQ